MHKSISLQLQQWQRKKQAKRVRKARLRGRERERSEGREVCGWCAKHFIALFFVCFPFIFLLQLPTEALPQNKTATTPATTTTTGARSEIQFAVEMKTKIEITIKPGNVK